MEMDLTCVIVYIVLCNMQHANRASFMFGAGK